MAKRKSKPKPKQKPKPVDPAQQGMTDAVLDQADILTCPVELAADLAETCADLAKHAETEAMIAHIATELHAGPASWRPHCARSSMTTWRRPRSLLRGRVMAP